MTQLAPRLALLEVPLNDRSGGALRQKGAEDLVQSLRCADSAAPVREHHFPERSSAEDARREPHITQVEIGETRRDCSSAVIWVCHDRAPKVDALGELVLFIYV